MKGGTRAEHASAYVGQQCALTEDLLGVSNVKLRVGVGGDRGRDRIAEGKRGGLKKRVSKRRKRKRRVYAADMAGLSQAQELRMKQRPPSEHSARSPSPSTSRHTRLSAVALLRQRPRILVFCGYYARYDTARRPQPWEHPWSTNIQPYFVILYSLVFGMPSLTFLRL